MVCGGGRTDQAIEDQRKVILANVSFLYIIDVSTGIHTYTCTHIHMCTHIHTDASHITHDQIAKHVV